MTESLGWPRMVLYTICFHSFHYAWGKGLLAHGQYMEGQSSSEHCHSWNKCGRHASCSAQAVLGGDLVSTWVSSPNISCSFKLLSVLPTQESGLLLLTEGISDPGHPGKLWPLSFHLNREKDESTPEKSSTSTTKIIHTPYTSHQYQHLLHFLFLIPNIHSLIKMPVVQGPHKPQHYHDLQCHHGFPHAKEWYYMLPKGKELWSEAEILSHYGYSSPHVWELEKVPSLECPSLSEINGDNTFLIWFLQRLNKVHKTSYTVDTQHRHSTNVNFFFNIVGTQ